MPRLDVVLVVDEITCLHLVLSEHSNTVILEITQRGGEGVREGRVGERGKGVTRERERERIWKTCYYRGKKQGTSDAAP